MQVDDIQEAMQSVPAYVRYHHARSQGFVPSIASLGVQLLETDGVVAYRSRAIPE